MAVTTNPRSRQKTQILTVVTDKDRLRVPLDIHDLDGFRRWLDTDEAPEKARVDFYRGEVWIDMGREQIFTHGLLKTEIAAVLLPLVKAAKSGYYFCNGVLVTNVAADLSGNPDGTFVSYDALTAKRVTLIPGKETGFVELEGTVDMVLEVVSDSSERKDNQVLLEAYWEAGIPEYWLVDARGKDLEFDVFRRGAKKYTATRKADGWVKSAAFGKAFKLTRGTDPQGNPEFTLESK